jgi:hypothetical protein
VNVATWRQMQTYFQQKATAGGEIPADWAAKVASDWNKVSCGEQAVYSHRQRFTLNAPPDGSLLKAEAATFAGETFEEAMEFATKMDSGKYKPASLDTLNSVVRAIWSLVTETQNKKPLVQAGGIEAMIAAMERHPDDGDLQSDAVTTLWLLLMDPKENRAEKKHFRDSQGIEAGKTIPVAGVAMYMGLAGVPWVCSWVFMTCGVGGKPLEAWVSEGCNPPWPCRSYGRLTPVRAQWWLRCNGTRTT